MKERVAKNLAYNSIEDQMPGQVLGCKIDSTIVHLAMLLAQRRVS